MIRSHLKRYILRLPLFFRVCVAVFHDFHLWIKTKLWENRSYPKLPTIQKTSGPTKNVLIYMISGLNHSGTDKSLQTIANALASEYRVVFMYGNKIMDPARQALLDTRIKQIPFSYSHSDEAAPHFIHNMKPHFKEVLQQEKIDIIITASAGQSEYPWNIVRNVPIILTNLFGAPSTQKNLVAISFVSPLTFQRASLWTGKLSSSHVNFLPCGQPLENTRELGEKLRDELNIAQDAFVFGRIGRGDDGIYDPIGIKAWQRIANKYPKAHLIVKSPPPKLIEFLKKQPLPNVHLLSPSGSEVDVWAFHGALDAMAHFRHDGETGGVAIGESLSVGNPILTHMSHIANAHVDYLTPECARVAGLDNDEEYAQYMEEFINMKYHDSERWKSMKESAVNLAKEKFSSDSYGQFFKQLLRQI